MAVTGNILSVYSDATRIYAAVWVTETSGRVEYIGSVPLTGDLAAYGFAGSQWTDLSLAQKKTALQTAVKAVRDGLPAVPAAVAGITGTVTL